MVLQVRTKQQNHLRLKLNGTVVLIIKQLAMICRGITNHSFQLYLEEIVALKVSFIVLAIMLIGGVQSVRKVFHGFEALLTIVEFYLATIIPRFLGFLFAV